MYTLAEPQHIRQGEAEGTTGKRLEGQKQLLGLPWDLGIPNPDMFGARFLGFLLLHLLPIY